MFPDVLPNQRWRRYTGTICRVICLAFREDDRAIVVVYAEENNGWRGCLPLFEWHDYVERGVRRYTLIEEGK